jgi:ubiquitin carboxyl-terminal hydrolase 25/28
LNELFANLACAEAPAVLPEVELAKLALMTSKDEEAESHQEQEANGTSTGSADTDSTLVETQIGSQLPHDEDTVQTVSPSSPFLRRTTISLPQSSFSVLGKRSSEEVELEHNERRSPMEVDNSTTSNTQDNVCTQFVTVTENDVEMQNPKTSTSLSQALPNAGPPPLPPRRRTEGVGEMMFGELRVIRLVDSHS